MLLLSLISVFDAQSWLCAITVLLDASSWDKGHFPGQEDHVIRISWVKEPCEKNVVVVVNQSPVVPFWAWLNGAQGQTASCWD